MAVMRKGNAHKKHVRGHIYSHAERTCARKCAYGDKGNALAGARGRIASGGAAKLWVYRCGECKRWHITSWDKGPGTLYPAHVEE
ncbi:hypothetical protein [Cupriavidus metallidurans]